MEKIKTRQQKFDDAKHERMIAMHGVANAVSDLKDSLSDGCDVKALGLMDILSRKTKELRKAIGKEFLEQDLLKSSE